MNTLKFRPDFIPSLSAREADQLRAASQVFRESMEMPRIRIRKRCAENMPGRFVWPIPGYVWLASAKTVNLPAMIPEADFEDPDDMKIVALDADCSRAGGGRLVPERDNSYDSSDSATPKTSGVSAEAPEG
jgi:hypothetical protein